MFGDSSVFNTQWAPKRIAHAGGGLGNLIYNNSEAAIRENVKRGYLWYEIDFLFENDVLVTDADRAAAVTGDITASYYSAKDEGKATRDKVKGTQKMGLEQLASLMREFPRIKIVPDVKDVERNIEAMQLMMDILPDSGQRVLPQIFQPEECRGVREMGFEHVIWTLYNYAGDDDDVLCQLKAGLDVGYVTMPIARAEGGLAHAVTRVVGLPSLAHTVNDPALLQRLQCECGVAEVYSDFVSPADDAKTVGGPEGVVCGSPEEIIEMGPALFASL